METIPRLVVAGVASGVGKTTVTVGLCRALRARGLTVAAFKCGPDYLDPTYHRRATGAASHNLDGWLMGRAAVLRTFARGAAGADVAVIEGVMGLFDGASPRGDQGSTAEIARWLEAPVLLVVDAGGMARTLAAVVAGFTAFDPALTLTGVIANRVGSRGHLELLRAAVPGAVLGGLPVSTPHVFPDRHLGLRAADEQTIPEAVLDAWGALVAEWCDLDVLLARARETSPLPLPEPEVAIPIGRCRIGLAVDQAFHFYYADNLRRLEALGAELVPFSPLRDRLPAVDGIYLGGGYPEAHAAALAANTPLLEGLREHARRGRPLYAECGGLMLLCEAIRTLDGRRHPMAGVLPGEAVMSDRLEALGYVEVETRAPCLLGGAGLRFRGHQFRYSRLTGAEAAAGAYAVRRRRGGGTFSEGYHAGGVLGSYVHAHWASNPLAAEGFVRACVREGRR